MIKKISVLITVITLILSMGIQGFSAETAIGKKLAPTLKVALRCLGNNRFVGVNSTVEPALTSDKTIINSLSTFEVIDNANGTYSLKSSYNGKYVTTNNDSLLVANSSNNNSSTWFIANVYANGKISLTPSNSNNIVYVDQSNLYTLKAISNQPVSLWNQFEVINLSGIGDIAFKSTENNNYVCAEDSGESYLIANRTGIDTWETFSSQVNSKGQVFLKSKANEKYVSIYNNGGKLKASASTIGNSELFEILNVGFSRTVLIRSVSSNNFLCLENGELNPLTINSSNAGALERFRLINLTSGCRKIALKCMENFKYVCAENNGNAPLIANKEFVGSSETFDVIYIDDNKFFLRSNANNLIVSADGWAEKPLIANRTWCGSWENFEISGSLYGNVTIKSVYNSKYVSTGAGGNSSLMANRITLGTGEVFYIILMN